MIKNFSRWHPKVALRYLPIAKKIRNLNISNPKVLEIGSGSLGIAPYLGRPVTGIDLNFSGPQTDLLTKIYGDVLKLPFKDQSFDVVLMVDVLEHIPVSKRINVIKETFRVAKHLFILAVPCGNLAQEEDQFLAQYYKKIHNKQFPYYREHLDFGLPQCAWVNATIKAIAKNSKRKINLDIQSNLNLSVHRFLMKGWITKNVIIEIIFRKILLIFIPLLLRLNKEPTYRKIFYIEFKS